MILNLAKKHYLIIYKHGVGSGTLSFDTESDSDCVSTALL